MDPSLGSLRSLARRALDHDIAGLSAELAYRFLFALFPFMLFLSALGGFVASWLGIADPATRAIDAVSSEVPPELVATIRPQLEAVLGSTSPALLSFGAIAALWAATGGTNALIKAMNRAYGVEDTRSFLGRYVVAVGLTLLVVGGIIASFAAIAGGAVLSAEVVAPLGIGSVVWTALELLRFPIVVMLLVVAVAILYRLAPAVRAPWTRAFLGATVFAIGWVVATVGFSVYLSRFGSYASTYGALAGVIVLMLWFYLTALVLLLGAEVVASSSAVATTQDEPMKAARTVLDTGVTNIGPAGGSRPEASAPIAPIRPIPALARRRPAPPEHEGRAVVVPLSVVGIAVGVGALLGVVTKRLLPRDD